MGAVEDLPRFRTNMVRMNERRTTRCGVYSSPRGRTATARESDNARSTRLNVRRELQKI